MFAVSQCIADFQLTIVDLSSPQMNTDHTDYFELAGITALQKAR
jgi:hypothetical protein